MPPVKAKKAQTRKRVSKKIKPVANLIDCLTEYVEAVKIQIIHLSRLANILIKDQMKSKPKKKKAK